MHRGWVCTIAKDARCVVDLAFGVGGYLLRKADYPLAPLVLALVLGPLMEKSFRQTLIAEQGNILAFVERPLSATFIGLAILFLVMPFAVAFITGAKERLHVPSKRPKIN